MKYLVTTTDFEHFIADWLSSDHPDYQLYVKGVKLFREYLEEEKQPNPVQEKQE